MSSKEQNPDNDKASTKKRPPSPAIEKLDFLSQQQTHPATIIERTRLDAASLTPGDILQLQRTIGNQAVGKLLSQVEQRNAVYGGGKSSVQTAMEEETIQTAPLQAKPEPNRTGMPAHLKAGIEALSGMDMSATRVHTNSDKPAQLNASAFTQGTDIHLGPGQEQYLPHEAWHVVQQKQGRVMTTLQAKGVAINDDPRLEQEADVMGEKATEIAAGGILQGKGRLNLLAPHSIVQKTPVIQRGGTKWVEHGGREHVEKIGTSGGITAHYTRDSSGNYYVEGWTEGSEVPAGEVKIEPGNMLALHTKSDSSARGGLGDKLMPIALKQIARYHSDAEEVLLPMGGGAVIKMMIGALSKVFGDPEIHALAEQERLRRKQEQEQELSTAGSEEELERIKESRKVGVGAFNPSFLGEHGLHLNALLSTDKGQRIKYISNLYVRLAPDKDTEMSIQDHLKRIISQPAMQVIMPMDLFVEFARSM